MSSRASPKFAEALRQLGDLGPAQAYAEEALATADRCHVRGQVHRYATLAIVLAARGELEQGADAASQMLDRAQGMESRRVRDRAMAVSDALTGRGDSIVAREVSERVQAQFAVPI